MSGGPPKNLKKIHLTYEQQVAEDNAKEKRVLMEKFGIAENDEVANMQEYRREFNLKLMKHPEKIRKDLKKKDLKTLKKEIEEEAAAAQMPELEDGIEYCKNKFLFPFGDIAPLADQDPNKQGGNGLLHDGSQSFADLSENLTNKDAFNKLCREKYQLPREVAERKAEWIPELQKPINVTVPDIRKELNVFITHFPRE